MSKAALQQAKPLAARLLALCLLAWLLAAPAWAQVESEPVLPAPAQQEVWLLTYGPGTTYWQRFGHNAIWLREPDGLDHAFNFGFFDFDQAGFLGNFLRGRLQYFAAAVDVRDELAAYQREGRSIRAQRLNLSADEFLVLKAHLLHLTAPANRSYLYDYYLNNCSTQLRDTLDLALNGALAARFINEPARQNFRQHTRRSTQNSPLYYLGLELGLGRPVDAPIDRWAEMFLPAVLADSLMPLQRGGQALVSEDLLLSAGTVTAVPMQAGITWPLFAGVGLLLIFLLLGSMAMRRLPPALTLAGVFSWLFISGMLGLGLTFLWFFTDHAFSQHNANLLLCNPLWLLAFLPPLRRMVAVLMLLGLIAAVAMVAWPSGQYMDDMLVLVGPLNLIVALLLWQGLRPSVPNVSADNG